MFTLKISNIYLTTRRHTPQVCKIHRYAKLKTHIQSLEVSHVFQWNLVLLVACIMIGKDKGVP